MYTDRQIKFLISRFNNDVEHIKDYLNDICSRTSVEDLAKKYSTNKVQIQRDRNNFTNRSILPNLLNTLIKYVES